MPKKQKSGLYRSKVKIGVDASGKDINKWISGSTKAELERARQDIIRHYILGVSAQADRLFGDYAVEWFRVHKEPGLSPSSRESYRTALNKDILPGFGNRQLRAITSGDLQAFVNSFSGCSATKITYIIATLRGVFRQACADSIIPKDPSAFLKKPAPSAVTEKYVLTDADRTRIAQVCATHQHGLYLACMFYLGVRPGEARGLMWGDFDADLTMVHIQRDIDYKANAYSGALKTSSSDRRVPVPSSLRALLIPFRRENDSYLFCGEISRNPLSKSTAERIWVSLMVACRLANPIPNGSNKYRSCDIRSQYKPLFTPHTLRHNYITMCWESGIDAYTTSKLVGHKSIKTTLDIYTHLSDKQMTKASLQIDSMFGAIPPS